MALFLLLSFLFLSTSVLSFFAVGKAAESASPSKAENTNDSTSVSFFVCNFIDFLEAENFAFKLGLGPAYQSRKVLSERNSQLFGSVILICYLLLLSFFALRRTQPPLNSARITEFLHAKDGMI
ncbi:MAG: hypothetical protein EOM51_04400 [Clostridia bacterium]|nr:hypothetical protein [Clostridia bacterium]